MSLRELDILARIRAVLPGGECLMDDCGSIPSPEPGETLLVTTDLMEESIHFRPDWHPPGLLGRKLLSVNLSDLDASGARPLGFTLTLALPPNLEMDWLESLLQGLASVARDANIPVLGGDTVGRLNGIGLGITAFGAARRWLRRDGMQPGDRIFVDQPLGRSLLGLRKLQAGVRWDPSNPDPDISSHLDPKPSLGLGLRLSQCAEVHACIDLSDGLSKDLSMLAESSRASVRLAPGLSHDELSGGEDYARCFASSLSQRALESRLGVSLREVGVAIPRTDAPLLVYDGDSWIPLNDRSFDHFAPRPDLS